MYESHPKLKTPEDENVVIWRYMPFWKFECLVKQNSLHFAKVGSFPNEGELSQFNDIHRRKKYADKPFRDEKQFNRALQIISIGIKASNMKYRDLLLINSWHFNNDVNDIMRKKYGEIAIKSTYRQLRDSFQDNHDDVIWIGEIDYSDIDDQWADESNTLSPFFVKGNNDNYERELRAATCLPDDDNSQKILSDADRERERNFPSKQKALNTMELTPNGKLIKINLHVLISAIYIDPKACDEFAEKIRELCSKYNLHKEIIKIDA